MPNLLILNYHRILDSNETIDSKYKSFTFDKKKFYEQIKLIYSLKIPVINLNEIGKNEHKDRFCIAITLDDGNLSDLTIAAPILQEFGYRATIFPVIQNIGEPGYLSWEDLTYLSEKGFTIGSHSLNHPKLTTLSDHEMQVEIADSKKALETNLGKPCDFFSIPFGSYNLKVTEWLASSNYRHSLSTYFGINSGASANFILKRWNIKKTTRLFVFQKVIRNNQLFVKTLQLFGKMKRYISSRIRD